MKIGNSFSFPCTLSRPVNRQAQGGLCDSGIRVPGLRLELFDENRLNAPDCLVGRATRRGERLRETRQLRAQLVQPCLRYLGAEAQRAEQERHPPSRAVACESPDDLVDPREPRSTACGAGIDGRPPRMRFT